jgi:hypothetical protein
MEDDPELGLMLKWGDVNTKKMISGLKLAAIEKIVYGAKSPNFQKGVRDDMSEPYWHCFTVIVKDSFKTVDLCCRTESDVNVWVRGLQSLVHKVDYKSCWGQGKLLWRMAYFKLVYTADQAEKTLVQAVADAVGVAAGQQDDMNYW